MLRMLMVSGAAGALVTEVAKVEKNLLRLEARVIRL